MDKQHPIKYTYTLRHHISYMLCDMDIQLSQDEKDRVLDRCIEICNSNRTRTGTYPPIAFIIVKVLGEMDYINQ